jgi:IS5 family transposase
LPKVARDKEARIGCKNGNKFWYGYKKHVSVDMSSGLINKIAVTAANITDGKGFEQVMPESGSIYADKAYCMAPTTVAAAKAGLHLCAVKRNNMRGKNFDLDRYYTKLRSPFESIFAQDNKRVRYLGRAKNQFAELMNAICFNLRRLTVITA